MELIKNNKDWFLSEEGGNYFAALTSLEDQTIFIYSYLKLVVNECFERKNVLFKIAFFFADGIAKSNKPYSKHPQILNSDINPFLNYLEKVNKLYGNDTMFLIFTSILLEKADVYNSDEWIYDDKLLSSDDLLDKLCDMGLDYLPIHSLYMVNSDSYAIKDEDKFLQLEIVWLFLK